MMYFFKELFIEGKLANLTALIHVCPSINHIREHTFFSQRKINFVIKLNASISEDVMVEIMASPGWGNSNKTDFALNVTIFYLDKTPFISPVSY